MGAWLCQTTSSTCRRISVRRVLRWLQTASAFRSASAVHRAWLCPGLGNAGSCLKSADPSCICYNITLYRWRGAGKAAFVAFMEFAVPGLARVRAISVFFAGLWLATVPARADAPHVVASIKPLHALVAGVMQ